MSTPQHTIKAVIRPGDESGYVAECLEISVITQGRTLDEVHTYGCDLLLSEGALVKRGHLMLPSFGALRTFGASHVPGPLPIAEVPHCPQAQSLAFGMCPSIPHS